MGPALLRALSASSLGLCFSACVYGTSSSSTPTYGETEVNDSADLADYFGVLHPGERFFIRGFISDAPFDPFDPFNGYDPFDGFAFTAGQPIHVEFRLTIADPFADLDVCLYDPQLDLVVDCFQSPFNPELGGVDVLFGGLDFHLVVESFAGSASYTVEIEVFELGAAPPQADTALAGLADPRTQRAGANAAVFEAYAPRPVADDEVSILPFATLFAIDPATGTVLRTRIAAASDGSWLGIPVGDGSE
jgi:hypothetical protein